MKKQMLFLFVFIISIELSAQIPNPLRYPNQDYDTSYVRSSVLGLQNGDILFFWEEKADLFVSRSIDNGQSWSQPVYIDTFRVDQTKPNDNISSAILDSNKIALVYRDNAPNYYSIIFSYDNGLSWSAPLSLPVGLNAIQKMLVTSVSLNKVNNEIYLCFSLSNTSAGIYCIKSVDNGNSWSSRITISSNSNIKNGFMLSLENQSVMLVYEILQNNNSDIYSITSSDNGNTWSSPSVVAGSNLDERRPRIIKDSANVLWLFYELRKETPFTGYYQSDIVYRKSFDNGNTWTAYESFTEYRGNDFNCEVTLINSKPFISFSSSRDFQINRKTFQLYFGIAEETIDNNAPPYIYSFKHIPEYPEPLTPYIIRSYVDDEMGIKSVKLISQKNYGRIDTLIMFDDGLNGDSLSNDGIYGITFNDLVAGDLRIYSFLIEDIDSNTVHFNGGIIFISLYNLRDRYTIDVNKIKLPINNSGVIADVNDTSGHGSMGLFEESSILFSAGFYLSGYTNNELWGNGVSSSNLVLDYLPGKFGSSSIDPKNKIYVIKSSDVPFGQSWQEWRYAVEQGADFYDGDGDGIYNPIDLNENGIWDIDEDRPDFSGDVTAWCVYNDGIPFNQRRFYGVNPQGIEIQQTAFASGLNSTGHIQNIIFFRYRIINTGTVAEVLDSVIFGISTDPDIGNNYDYDFVGTDTLLGSGFAYKKNPDSSYGNNPPALLTGILQGPISYIAGETFLDNNSNGVYDPGIDTPVDTAYHYNGPFIGKKSFPGAKNLNSSSFINFNNGHSSFVNDPDNSIELRNFMSGKNRIATTIDPCNWSLGSVLGNVNCNEVNPYYWYSGDPLSNVGWINTQPWDQRMLLNTGKFQLKENQPIDIWVAYIVGRGNNPLNSVGAAKEINISAIDFYKSNFTLEPSSVPSGNEPVNSYHLFQNYPNPFNPITKIIWQSPVGSHQVIKVFDVLGREVATLVDEFRNAGSYEVEFDGSSLASGIYFYQLKVNDFITTKKMMLLR